jgi:hypothetical protein
MVALSRNHICNENATMRSLCIAELHVTVNNLKFKIKWCTKMLLWRIYVAGNNDTYLVSSFEVTDIFVRF